MLTVNQRNALKKNIQKQYNNDDPFAFRYVNRNVSHFLRICIVFRLLCALHSLAEVGCRSAHVFIRSGSKHNACLRVDFNSIHSRRGMDGMVK